MGRGPIEQKSDRQFNLAKNFTVKMSETPPSLYGWVDISREDSPELGDTEDFIRMLREAQMEDGLASPMTSSSSPIFINKEDRDDLLAAEAESCQPWDWSSRPNILPPKHWNLRRRHSTASSVGSVSCQAICGHVKDDEHEEEDDQDTSLMCLVMTNLVSLLVGTSIGVLLYKRNSIKHLSL